MQEKDVDPLQASPPTGSAAPPVSARASGMFPGAALAGLVVFVLGLLVTLLLWQLLQRSQDVEIERETQAAARAAANAVESWVDGEYDALRKRAVDWPPASRAGPDAWEREATAFLNEHPSFSALALLQGGEPREIVGSAVALLRAREAFGGATKTTGRQETVLGPIGLPGERHAFAVQMPLGDERAGSRAPWLFAVLEPTTALRALLERQAPDYETSLLVDGVQIQGRAAAPGVATPASFEKTETVALALGSSWTLAVRPREEILARKHGAPRVVLLTGLVISVLISTLVHAAQLSRERARALQTNVDLRDEIARTRHGESEIRLLNESLEARVQERTAELHETIAELETFNYSVSHDLRSPLGAIINFAAILKEDYEKVLDTPGREYLDRLVSSARVAVSMMDALLAFSRSGRDEVRKSRVDMGKLVEDVAAERTVSLPGSPVHVRIDPLPDAWADPSMMRFVFTNLIGNACKFTREGESPRVEVGGQASDAEVSYFVRDQGIGFDMRYATKLFRVFERVHTGGGYDGHGVGLAIVARLVRRHGGRVWAQGAVGKGATFHFSLPVEPALARAATDAGVDPSEPVS